MLFQPAGAVHSEIKQYLFSTLQTITIISTEKVELKTKIALIMVREWLQPLSATAMLTFWIDPLKVDFGQHQIFIHCFACFQKIELQLILAGCLVRSYVITLLLSQYTLCVIVVGSVDIRCK